MLSGIIHAAGDVHKGEGHLDTSFRFFAIQAFAVALEDAVIALTNRTGLSRSTLFNRLVGYSWVGLWFGLLMPYMMRWCVDNGWTRERLFPLSPARLAIGFAENYYGVDILSCFE